MIRKIANFGSLMLAGLLPFSAYWPIGKSVNDSIYPLYVTPVVYITDLPLLLLLSVGLLFGLRFQKKSQKANRFQILVGSLLGVIVLLAAVTLPWALSPVLAAWTLFRWFLAIALYFTLILLNPPIERFVQVFLCSLAIQVAIGLGQVIISHPLGIPGELALDMTNPRAAVIYATGRGWLRAYGMTFHPNVFGGFLMAGLVLGFPLLNRTVWRILWLWLAVGLLLTFSRSAWLATLICLPIAAGILAWRISALRRSIFIMVSGLCVFSLVMGIIFSKPIIARIFVSTSYSELASIDGRRELIQVAMTTIRDHPLTGIGAGNFPLAQLDQNTKEPAHYVHNVILLLAAEEGLVGGFVWLALWLVPLFFLPLRNFHNPWSIVSAAAWFGLGSISLWDSYPWALEYGRLLTVVLLALLTLALDEETNR